MNMKPLALVALAAIALAATPSASACVYQGAAADTVNYVLPCSSFGAGDDAQSVVDFVLDVVVPFVVDLVTGVPLPP